MSAVRWPLVREVLRKDLEEIARSRQLLYPLFVLPVFLTGDALLVFSTSVLSHNNPRLGLGDAFFSFASFLLVLPVILPILLGSAAVVMEKTNHTLESLLSTPLTDTELLVGKSLGPLVPAMALTAASYAVYGVGAELLVRSHAPGASLPWGSFLLTGLLLAPLLGLLATFVAIAVSTKAKDVRSAQQLASLVLLPLLIPLILIGIALGPMPLYQLALAAAVAALALLVLRVTTLRFHRDQILVAGV